MGADGFVVDPTQSYDIKVTCHMCGRPVWENDPPINYHHECVSSDGRLAVNVEISNYEDR